MQLIRLTYKLYIMSSKEIIKQDGVGIQEVFYLDNLEQLKVYSDPIRYQMVNFLTEPMTGAQLARKLGIARAKAHYHLNCLKDVGIVQFYGEGESHGITEKYYQVVGRMLDFSRILRPTDQAIMINQLTPETCKVLGNFLGVVLDVSKKNLEELNATGNFANGSWFNFSSGLTPEQLEMLQMDLRRLQEKIIKITAENKRVETDADLVDFRVTWFLTLMKDQM